jgi:hypothetical protein
MNDVQLLSTVALPWAPIYLKVAYVVETEALRLFER